MLWRWYGIRIDVNLTTGHVQLQAILATKCGLFNLLVNYLRQYILQQLHSANSNIFETPFDVFQTGKFIGPEHYNHIYLKFAESSYNHCYPKSVDSSSFLATNFSFFKLEC